MRVLSIDIQSRNQEIRAGDWDVALGEFMSACIDHIFYIFRYHIDHTNLHNTNLAIEIRECTPRGYDTPTADVIRLTCLSRSSTP
jgi:hypothetical protein